MFSHAPLWAVLLFGFSLIAILGLIIGALLHKFDAWPTTPVYDPDDGMPTQMPQCTVTDELDDRKVA